MSIPGDLSRSLEDKLLGQESSPTVGDRLKNGFAQGLGTAVGERMKHRQLNASGRTIEEVSAEYGAGAPPVSEMGGSGGSPSGPVTGSFAEQARQMLQAQTGGQVEAQGLSRERMESIIRLGQTVQGPMRPLDREAILCGEKPAMDSVREARGLSRLLQDLNADVPSFMKDEPTSKRRKLSDFAMMDSQVNPQEGQVVAVQVSPQAEVEEFIEPELGSDKAFIAHAVQIQGPVEAPDPGFSLNRGYAGHDLGAMRAQARMMMNQNPSLREYAEQVSPVSSSVSGEKVVSDEMQAKSAFYKDAKKRLFEDKHPERNELDMPSPEMGDNQFV